MEQDFFGFFFSLSPSTDCLLWGFTTLVVQNRERWTWSVLAIFGGWIVIQNCPALLRFGALGSCCKLLEGDIEECYYIKMIELSLENHDLILSWYSPKDGDCKDCIVTSSSRCNIRGRERPTCANGKFASKFGFLFLHFIVSWLCFFFLSSFFIIIVVKFIVKDDWVKGAFHFSSYSPCHAFVKSCDQ